MLFADLMMPQSLRSEIHGRLHILKSRHESEGCQVPHSEDIDHALAWAEDRGQALALEFPGPLERDLDTYTLFVEKAIKVCRAAGCVGIIVLTGWYSGSKFSALRRFVARTTDPRAFVNLPYDVFAAWVDTTVFVLAKRAQSLSWPRKARCVVALKTFPKRHKIESASEFEGGVEEAELTHWFAGGADGFLTYAASSQSAIIRKAQTVGKPLADFGDVQRGVTPFHLTTTREHKNLKVIDDQRSPFHKR